MDRTDAAQVISFLCWKAGVPTPSKVEWNARSRRGRYRRPVPRKSPRGTIIIGPKAWRGVINSTIHEVAHHVVAMRAPTLTAKERRSRRGFFYEGRYRRSGQTVHHGPVFLDTLIELSEYWFGHPSGYSWDTEYASLRRVFTD